MKTTITLSIFLFLFIGFSNAQMVKSPLDDQTSSTKTPTAPEGDYSWVKGYWDWDGFEYQWKEGEYVATVKNHEWVDGDWERDNSTGAWFYSDGYWMAVAQATMFSGGTKEDDVSATTASTFGTMFK